jgi:5-methylcytosine-specific restriction endonuclease McrA
VGGWGRSMRERWARIRDARAEARAARRNRSAGTTCFYCGAAFDDTAPDRVRTADHRVPRAAGGHDGLANLVFACFACNQAKADRPEADFIGSAWLTTRRLHVATLRSRQAEQPDT